LLGAQAAGSDGVDKRIDVLATALRGGMTVHDLAELELAYAPPYGSARDPVNLAGMAAANVLAGDVKLAQWHEIQTLSRPADTLSASHGNRDGAGDAPVLLDVRDADERAKGHIRGSIHIPLSELRGRLSELPKDQEIVVYCQSGQRSYYACRVLTQRGFRARNLSGSYRTWKTAGINRSP
jgi:rhodanese-related sulfurtransferase